MLHAVVPGKAQFKPGLTQWAGQNQFYPGKMPTLRFVLLKLTTDRHKALRGLFATAELFVFKISCSEVQ